ncbi:SDR family oxidoreductase [Rhizorhabdus wittichii]|jgi:NAD(P)-dependent dehydrogenase (short-subunit alcohol dehydrogenase family)|uniref:SDR family oxidoreductase n=1 Tax=Rhizorhabdus wittichii TaxID=160791 RepID=A0A975D1S8_9SPHN|nr:SDR family oxidoreductase [Rhizorhabdus wittichii]QTH21333.1 SDR family oxidoreductase [Rhizorhabdus wittichii]
MISLDGKVAIVTGATQGLGAGIAASLHAAGASVLVTGRDAERGAAVVAALGERAAFVAADIAQDEGVATCLDAALARFGRLDILVNNACLYADPGLGASREEWHRSLDVNLVGPALLIAGAAGHLPSPGGVIVNIGSVGGKFGAAGRLLYPASKAALMQLTKSAAVTLAPRGIRVLTVSPAWTWSPALAGMAGSEQRADAVGARTHPLGRVGRDADVGDVVVFACSDMARFMTGVDLPVDGGYSILGPDQGLGPRPWFEGGEQ